MFFKKALGDVTLQVSDVCFCFSVAVYFVMLFVLDRY